MGATGLNPVPLTSGAVGAFEPVWSPDGTKIAFVRCASDPTCIQAQTYNDQSTEIWTMNADGSNPVRLTNNTFIDQDPSWSPDAKRIAFASAAGGGPVQIWAMNADGSNATQLTSLGITNAQNDQPAWSPDGTKIAFVRSPTDEIWVMNANGTNQTQLTNNRDGRPAWSPDGSKIVFSTRRNGSFDVFVMNADGTSQTPLANSSRDET